MTGAEISSELKQAVIYSGRHRGAVARIADASGLSESTVYDYLEGRIKPSIHFIQACIIATDGDPAIKRLLEPKGWHLFPSDCTPPTQNPEKEVADIFIATSDLHRKIRDAIEQKHITKNMFFDIVKDGDTIVRQLTEAINLVRSIYEKEAN